MEKLLAVETISVEFLMAKADVIAGKQMFSGILQLKSYIVWVTESCSKSISHACGGERYSAQVRVRPSW